MSPGEPAGWSIQRENVDYPAALLDLAERAPEELFGRGDRDLLADHDPGETVTVVGSRRASAYGLGVAEELGRLLAAAGLVVVSGMAYGIDAASHRGALAGGGRTIAVLGGGPDVVYPATQRRLYRRILEHGAAISEWPPGQRPASWSFPARNRIMAALAAVTVVVEAAEPSGSLITARLATGLGRTVGAVPGQVTSTLSEGTNRLLFDGALVVRGAQDVLDHMLGIGAHGVRSAGPVLDPGLARVLELVERGHTTCDAVVAASGGPPHDAAVALARLELLGYLRGGAGGRFSRTTSRPP